jgi:hypothetical protein
LYLTPFSDQQIAERLDDLGMLSVDAALALCHHGKDQMLIHEIATEVNRALKDRGERIQYSPEKVGHTLKKARPAQPAGKRGGQWVRFGSCNSGPDS